MVAIPRGESETASSQVNIDPMTGASERALDAEQNVLSKFLYYRGRVALQGLLAALGVGPGDRVATQAFTCLAVPEGILASGAAPLWVDVEKDGFTMDPEDLGRRLQATTKAIVVQHTFGIPARLDAILAVARSRGIPVVEDCCHTLASRLHGSTVGSFGCGAFYSFEWGKPIVAGIGGAAVVNDARLRERVAAAYGRLVEPPASRVLRTQAQYAAFSILFRPSLYWPARAAFHALSAVGAAEGNYHAVSAKVNPEFGWCMAAPLRRRLSRQLPTLARRTAHSRALVAAYRAGLAGSGVRLPEPPEGSETVFVRFPLLTECKEEMLRAARRAGVELADWYATPIHPLRREEWPAVGYEAGLCPNAESVAARVVTLPTHLRAGRQYADRAVDFLAGFSR